jgi:hypothetical protein
VAVAAQTLKNHKHGTSSGVMEHIVRILLVLFTAILRIVTLVAKKALKDKNGGIYTTWPDLVHQVQLQVEQTLTVAEDFSTEFVHETRVKVQELAALLLLAVIL